MTNAADDDDRVIMRRVGVAHVKGVEGLRVGGVKCVLRGGGRGGIDTRTEKSPPSSHHTHPPPCLVSVLVVLQGGAYQLLTVV